ncbi:MAG TPA: hypothetical protein VJA21_22430 [Verrucomicrobiae bacterium]
MMRRILLVTLVLSLLRTGAFVASAWDYEGHRTVNQLALSCLPTNFPAFVHGVAATERIAFLGGEADRWRNVPDLALRHCNGPDHYLDVEQLAVYGLNPEMLPVFRYDFVAQLALVRKEHPEKFPEPAAARNEDHTRELVGLLPWAIAENYAKLKSGFAYLKAYQQDGGTPDEIANAEGNILYVMGVLGHYVADASQPLHTTVHHHGWVGDNPQGYSTNSRIHGWIDGGYLAKVGGPGVERLNGKLREAKPVTLNGREAKPEEMFQAAVGFVMEQNRLVETLYQMEKEGKFSGEGDNGLAGKAFLETQLARSGQWLADLWYSAFQQAPPDTFLKRQLAGRKGSTAREKTN